MSGKFDDEDSGLLQKVKDDPYAELFADCVTTDEVLQLQQEIDSAEAAVARREQG